MAQIVTFLNGGDIAVDNLVDDLNVFGSFGVFIFSLQFPFSLMIELLIPALRLTGFLPKFVGAADNFHSGGLFHCGLSYFFRSLAPLRGSLPPHSRRATSPICSHLIYDRHNGCM